nr:prepilin-type N-terminal cleavage/methylation domain-containing protein [uncultured Dethiosulfovibrio sp.]
MKKDIKRNKRPGFTLVELLIVIIIIGILAGGMMMVAGAGTDKANATKIVSDLRNFKSASLMLYADTNSWPRAGENGISDIAKYIDRTIVSGDYDYITSVDFSGVTGDLVGYKGALLTSGVEDKLSEMAEASGLYGNTGSKYSSGNVYMRVR